MSKTAQDLLNVLRGWIGYSEANGKYKKIIDLYNSHRPLARNYKVKYTDEWCDTTVSAAAIASGMTDLIGTECGCEEHVKIFKSKGIWIENGKITPKPGYIILYNWDDSTQPNDGHSDHIGVVESVSGRNITVIEGNKGNAVRRRTIPVGWGYIRGYAAPHYATGSSKHTKPASATMTVDQAAKNIIAGKYGNGDARKKAIQALGLNYNAVQKRVNEILKGRSPSTPSATYYTIKRGDTLSSIAKKYGTTASAIQKLNSSLIKNVNRIQVGKKIRVK